MILMGSVLKVTSFKTKKNKELYRVMIFDDETGEVYVVLARDDGAFTPGSHVTLSVRPAVNTYRGQSSVIFFANEEKK